MKRLLLAACSLLFALGASAQGIWVSQATNFTPDTTGVRFVSAVDSNVVWICSYDGSGRAANRQDFSRTIDGGTTWVVGTVPAPASHDWSMIEAVSADSAWAVFYDADAGSGGGIWRTSDGGASWTQLGVGSIFNASSFPNVVYFWDAQNGWAMGDPNPSEFELYTTNDGGDTWTPVNPANIPNPLAGEYGIVGHFNVIGDNVWFDTNKGRVYYSNDRGLTWNVGSTGITVPANSAIDICFWSPTNGLARLYNRTTGANTVRFTTDGGATWTAGTITGTFFGSDVKHIPGTASKLISTGAETRSVGSSFSDDGGHTWNTIDRLAPRTALGVVDSLHMWSGGFTTSPTNGIFKYAYTVPEPVLCNDPSINPGIATSDVTEICEGDTATFTATGVLAPNEGDFSGVSWIISSADITGISDPLSDPSLVATYSFSFPAPSTSFRQFVNDGTLLGLAVPYGLYYWTPVVFANATNPGMTPPVFLSDLTLDPLCTYTGNSVPVTVYAPGDPACVSTGIAELKNVDFGFVANQSDVNTIRIRFQAKKAGNMRLEFMDLTGRVVSRMDQYIGQGLTIHELNATQLPAGTYIIRAEQNGVVGTGKVVKL
jgi:hypothetical protein